MHTPLISNSRGAGHIVAVIAIVVVAAVAAGGWFVFNQNQFGGPAKDAIKAAKCDYDDKDLCRYFAAWKANVPTRMTMEQKIENTTMKTIIESDGKNTRLVSEGAVFTETISTDKGTFNRIVKDGTWWKVYDESQFNDISEALNMDEPSKEEAKQYKSLGKEACGDMTCFKYEYTDKEANNAKTTVWFDDKEYLSRRAETKGEEAGLFKAVFTYDNIKIQTPADYKELKEGEYLVPGEDEPVSAEDAPANEAELEAFMRELEN
jgi:outer membrane lipoprotein-sorting protein